SCTGGRRNLQSSTASQLPLHCGIGLCRSRVALATSPMLRRNRRNRFDHSWSVPDSPLSANQPRAQASTQGCAAGVAPLHQSQAGGDWKPVVEWLIRNPHCAAELDAELCGERIMRAVVVPPMQAGTVIGGFQILEELGRGAMGVVFRAYDQSLK